MPQGNKRNKWSTIHWSAHVKGEQYEEEKCSYGMDWLKILDSRMSKNGQDISQSHKSQYGNHEKLGSGNWLQEEKL